MSKPQLKKEQQDNNEFIFKHKGRVIPPPNTKIEDVGEAIFCRDIMTAFVHWQSRTFITGWWKLNVKRIS